MLLFTLLAPVIGGNGPCAGAKKVAHLDPGQAFLISDTGARNNHTVVRRQ